MNLSAMLTIFFWSWKKKRNDIIFGHIISLSTHCGEYLKSVCNCSWKNRQSFYAFSSFVCEIRKLKKNADNILLLSYGKFFRYEKNARKMGNGVKFSLIFVQLEWNTQTYNTLKRDHTEGSSKQLGQLCSPFGCVGCHRRKRTFLFVLSEKLSRCHVEMKFFLLFQ